MNKAVKRVLSLVLAATLVVGGVVTTGTKAEAKAKSFTGRFYFAGADWQWMTKNPTGNLFTIKNKKGTTHYSITLKMKDAYTKKPVKAAQVCTIDVMNALSEYKASKIKYSNVVVKCDGKTVKINQSKLYQGNFEPDKGKNYRLSIYNEVGSDKWGDHSAKKPCAKPSAFKWKKSITVSFDLTLK